MAANNNTGVTTNGITSILDVPRDAAIQIFMEDKWFAKNPHETRYIAYMLDSSKTSIVTALKANDEAAVDKALENNPNLHFISIDISRANELTASTSTREDLTNELFSETMNVIDPLFAAFVFSVNGNKGPYFNVMEFLKSNPVMPQNDMEYKFLGHVAWALANDWDLGSDPLAREIISTGGKEDIYTGLDITKLFKDDGEKEKALYDVFQSVVTEVESSSGNNTNDITKIKRGLATDLERAKLYIEMSKRQHGNGR